MNFDLFSSLRLRHFAFIFFAQLFSIFGLAQVPLAEIEGRLSIYLPDDTTSVHIGKNAGINQDLTDFYANTFIGTSTGQSNTTGEANSFLGYASGFSNTTGVFNSYYGFASGADNEEGEGNSFFGAFSGDAVFTDTNEADYNSFFGFGSGANTTTGSYNCFFGNQSGVLNKSGKQNVGMGSSVLSQANSGGSYNAAVGDSSMYNVDTDGDIDGEMNAALGASSLFAKNSGYSNRSVAIGYEAGYDGGSRSVFLGFQAGKEASNTNDALYINNESGDTPLIYGEFDTQLVKVNGKLEATHSTVAGSYMKLQPVVIAPSCRVPLDEGTLYYDLSDHKLKICAGFPGPFGSVTYAWEDLH